MITEYAPSGFSRKKYTDYIISQADYEYLKRRLREDEQYTFYFIIRFITATGVRVSELISFQIQDVINGYKDIYSKGNKMRRVYIPTALQEDTLRWLESEFRKNGPLFLSHLKRGISVSGIRSQLKTFAFRYHLDPNVVYPHSFRHRFAKNFIENGGDIAFFVQSPGAYQYRDHPHLSEAEQYGTVTHCKSDCRLVME